MDPLTPTPDDLPRSALPSVGARIVAFAVVLLGGLAGGIIGQSFAITACTGACDVPIGGLTLLGSVLGAVGLAVVATLTLRAMGEWSDTSRSLP